MALHFIAILSHYKSGARIGWHYAAENNLDKEKIQEFYSIFKKCCGDIQIGIHKLSTDSLDWSSVANKDSFFKDVIVTKDVEHFVKMASTDKRLTAYDVAKYILAHLPCSHLKLQKLIYFSYTEFLTRTGEKLFDDKIVAFKYGPVVENVFFKFRHHGRNPIDYVEDDVFEISSSDIAVKPSFMKIYSSEHGLLALKCITEVLNKYKDFSASKLVDLTHVPDGPWSQVFRPGENREITDDLIIKSSNSSLLKI
ncbi:Panacea domain-containing protein [Bacillus sp. JCM 19034]|uniref:Panacea domain-containing protein n=1 Tax=Bacillus sp. JCM 19034 TaxID=1481928 RepID=UPI00078067C7|nr:type II toxin-antitoxin system antitoxin SocA domain-containing protein [Bacillus sp. JCM 19034]